MQGRRRRSDGSIDLENLSYALDSYGRPVLCEYDMKDRKFQRRKHATKWKSSQGLDDDLLTREEKAARIRAEIARRREQLLNSELEARYPSHGDLEDDDAYMDSGAGYLDDYEEPYGDMFEYEDEFYDEQDAIGIRGARLRSGPYLSRSLDNGIDDYCLEEYPYEVDDRRRGKCLIALTVMKHECSAAACIHNVPKSLTRRVGGLHSVARSSV